MMTLDEVATEASPITVEIEDIDIPFGGVQIIGATDQPIQIVLREGNQGPPGIPGPTGQTGAASNTTLQNGATPLVNGQNFVDVLFPAEMPNANWLSVNLSVVNLIDPNPLTLVPSVITAKTEAGFKLFFNGAPDSNNYFLQWGVFGGPVVPPPVASTYTLTGPSSGEAGEPSTNFIVALPPGSTVPSPVTITPNDGGAGGSFVPSTVILTTLGPSSTFTYTAASGGAKTISTTNDGGLTDPTPLTYTATAPFLKDTFTDTDGTLLTAHTMDFGPGWTKIAGSTSEPTIQSNKAQSTLDAVNFYSYVSDSGHADCTIKLNFVLGASDGNHAVGLYFRYLDSSNYWLLFVNGAASNVFLFRHQAGVDNTEASGAVALTSGVQYELSVTLSGNSISCLVNGVPFNATNSFNNTQTKHGMLFVQFVGANPVTIDDFLAQ